VTFDHCQRFFSLKIVQKSTLAPPDFAQDPNKQAGSYRQRTNWECLPPRLNLRLYILKGISLFHHCNHRTAVTAPLNSKNERGRKKRRQSRTHIFTKRGFTLAKQGGQRGGALLPSGAASERGAQNRLTNDIL